MSIDGKISSTASFRAKPVDMFYCNIGVRSDVKRVVVEISEFFQKILIDIRLTN